MKSRIDKMLDKARDFLSKDQALTDVLKDVQEARKIVAPSRVGDGQSKRLRVPYVDATPLASTAWK